MTKPDLRFKLRTPDGLYYNGSSILWYGGHSKTTADCFSKSGREWRSYNSTKDILLQYNLERVSLTQFPKLDLITYRVDEATVESDLTPDMTDVALFIQNARPLNGYHGYIGKMIMRLVAEGHPFQYVLIFAGSHRLTNLKKGAAVRRHSNQHFHRTKMIKGATVLLTPDMTDVVYAKMALSDHFLEAWDRSGQPLILS